MSYRIKLTQLRAYQAIMLSGSVTAAADRLHTTQPAISKQLVSLEQAVGFRLFDRTSGGRMVPTTLGLQFFRRVEGTLLGIEDIPTAAQDLLRTGHSRLKFGATAPLMNSSFVAQVLSAFTKSFPSARFALETRSRHDIEEWVANGQIDIGLALLPADNPLVKSFPLITANVVAVVPASHELAQREWIEYQDLGTTRIILPRNQLLRFLIDRTAAENGVEMDSDIEASSALTCCKLAASGIGIGLCDPFSPSAFHGDDVKVVGWRPAVPLTYGILVSARRERTEVEERMIEEIFRQANLSGWRKQQGV